MDLEIMIPEVGDTNKQNQIGMSSTKVGLGRISAMENIPKKTL